jgi:hypothetical protein
MSALAPAISLLELGRRLEATLFTTRDIRSLLYNLEFQAITNHTSQMLFLQQFANEKYLIHINTKTLTIFDVIMHGNV